MKGKPKVYVMIPPPIFQVEHKTALTKNTDKDRIDAKIVNERLSTVIREVHSELENVGLISMFDLFGG